MKANSWVEHYYEGLEFFYWEPQHLGRKRAENATMYFADVRKHLRSMEVTLNQLMLQFFSLAPPSFRNRVFEKAMGQQPVSGEFSLSGWQLGDGWPKWSTCQPDFFFTAPSENRTVSIEMKTTTKSNVGQVLKYALLALAAEQKLGQEGMKHSLIFLGPTSFASLWASKDSIKSVGELRIATSQEQVAFIEKRPKEVRELMSRFCEIVSTLEFGFINYAEIAELLTDEYESAKASASEIHGRLLDGMLGELQRRKLVQEKTVTNEVISTAP